MRVMRLDALKGEFDDISRRETNSSQHLARTANPALEHRKRLFDRVQARRVRRQEHDANAIECHQDLKVNVVVNAAVVDDQYRIGDPEGCSAVEDGGNLYTAKPDKIMMIKCVLEQIDHTKCVCKPASVKHAEHANSWTV